MSIQSVLYEKLLHWASVEPETPFIIEAETGKTLTYSQCLAAVQNMQQVLGSDPRCIILALPGGIANAVLWLSALTGGHTLIPIAPDAPAHELKHVGDRVTPDIVVLERLEDKARFQYLDAHYLAQAECEKLIQGALPVTDPISEPAEGWLYLTTSGSTGEPKGVVLGERQIAWTADQIRASHHLSPADRGLTVLPFFHINAPVVSLCASLMAGSTVVIASRFSRSRFWDWIEQYRITWASIVPTILAMLLQTEKPAFLPGALRFVRTASAPLPAIQLLQFEQRFGIPVIETYGLTEAASTVCANLVPPGRHIPGSVGKAVGVSLRVCYPRSLEGPQELQDVQAGQVGEICISGPSVISAYVGDAGAGAFQDGWFRTGDLGYQDAEGYVYLTGRIRDVIIRGGENISPREIEEALLAHPAIWEAVVTGCPDPVYGEQVVAHIVIHEVWTPELEQSLRDYCLEHLSHQKVPFAFIPTDALPRTHTGKIDRQQLRQKQMAGERDKAGIYAA